MRGNVGGDPPSTEEAWDRLLAESVRSGAETATVAWLRSLGTAAGADQSGCCGGGGVTIRCWCTHLHWLLPLAAALSCTLEPARVSENRWHRAAGLKAAALAVAVAL